MSITRFVKEGLTDSGAEVFSIGKSVCGEDILCAHAGRGGKKLIMTAGIHARECYTALVVLAQLRAFTGGGEVFFIPLVDSDGAEFFESGNTHGHGFLAERADLHKIWKANADGVDLNCNFDARWGSGKLNTRVPGAAGYIGEKPLCAPESAALDAFTRAVMPDATVSYHCMGGELYWEFFQTDCRARDRALAEAIANRIGVRRVDGDLGSAGGYKDMCVMSLGIPAFTVELISSGEHPFAPEDYREDIEKNIGLPEFILNLL